MGTSGCIHDCHLPIASHWVVACILLLIVICDQLVVELQATIVAIICQQHLHYYNSSSDNAVNAGPTLHFLLANEECNAHAKQLCRSGSLVCHFLLVESTREEHVGFIRMS